LWEAIATKIRWSFLLGERFYDINKITRKISTSLLMYIAEVLVLKYACSLIFWI
jgi:hypothetical protein